MPKTVAIGIQDFESLINGNYFYVDKTNFIKEWWEAGDSVTLITRPRRFGKTLNMSMLERFFSNKYEGQGEIFNGLSIWNDEKYRKLQGTYPVIFLSFAGIKEKTYELTVEKIKFTIIKMMENYSYLLNSDRLTEGNKKYIRKILNSEKLNEVELSDSLHNLSSMLHAHHDKKVLIFLDEYDTPMQEAYVNGFWNELVGFTRSMFNNAFKTNPYLERAIMTGITRVSKESMFSDLNNLNVITTTSPEYATSFGFTETEVYATLEYYKLDTKEEVKLWYDGFVFGNVTDIYNPWSIINYLSKKEFNTYWADTSSNGLLSSLIQKSKSTIKEKIELLLQRGILKERIDEQVIFDQIDRDDSALWSMMIASGYLKVLSKESVIIDELTRELEWVYTLQITNLETLSMMRKMVRGWFATTKSEYNDFVKAMLNRNLKEMNIYMNKVALETFSYFDSGKRPSGAEPERFYHGFVLGLMVELTGRYDIKSNRESGYGRYDIMLIPRDKATDDGIIIEFKVLDPEEETSIEETAANALAQIEEKKYDTELFSHGIPAERIHKYGFAFEGKTVKILSA